MGVNRRKDSDWGIHLRLSLVHLLVVFRRVLYFTNLRSRSGPVGVMIEINVMEECEMT